ncbi:Prophage integrase IntA [Saezia sanguinis]|uniref:Prophage integrase IntA n=1 Tax=Saezia sanguinis TaxID=1965230 RepID=A0A433SD72_9BURK|nr:site-specific integrase [Saezia sanguinis]RUS66693.1 Prophage integrase IntA [Saezia sanguinis]
MAEITERQLSTKPTDKDIWFNESAPKGHGRFLARITPAGERLFYFRYSDSSGKRVRLPLGTYSRTGTAGLTLKEARQRAMVLADLYVSGHTNLREYLETERVNSAVRQESERLRLEREKAEAEATAAAMAMRQTVRGLFEQWMEIDVAKHKDGGAEVRRMFEKDVLPYIGDCFVADVKKGDVVRVTDSLLARQVPRMAKRVFSLMRQMFRFAVDRDLIVFDPTAAIRKARTFGQDNERDRILDEDEIRLLVEKLPDAGLLVTTEIAVWIILATCCRIGELMNARWQYVNLYKRTWVIPADHSKNGKLHVIHLSDFAVSQFERLREINGTYEWCYPNAKKDGAVTPKSVTKQLGDRQCTNEEQRIKGRSKFYDALLLPNGKWTPHDLRRTGASMMTALGILPDVAERCLNHVEENKVKRTYQRYSYAKEIKEAWQMLGQELEKLVQAQP